MFSCSGSRGAKVAFFDEIVKFGLILTHLDFFGGAKRF